MSQHSRKAVIIDAGHGGRDPGAVGNGYREKDLALQDAFAFKVEMEQYEKVDVYMIRTTDVFVPINEIRRKTNEIAERYVKWTSQGKDYSNVAFVSHHWNSHEPSATGWEIWANYPNTSGNKLAVHIHREVQPELNIVDRGVKYARGGLGVLRANPATVLLEHAFISNKTDIVSHLGNRHNMAKAYARGVASYLGLEKKKEEASPKVSEERIREIVREEMTNLSEEIPSWAKDGIDYVQEQGIMQGSGGKFRPNAPVTRAELATVIERMSK